MVALRYHTPLIPPDLLQAKRVVRTVDDAQPGDVLVTWQQGSIRNEQILAAHSRGVTSVVCEEPLPVDMPGIAFTQVANARHAFALMSCAVHDMPPSFPLLGVTGTDGKTSLVHIAHHCLGPEAGRIGSLGMVCGNRAVHTGHTSPPSEITHDFLARLPDSCPGVAMEISSHAAHQFRYAGLPLAGLAFTGLGRDHLDYHKTMRAYLDAKLQCMDLLSPTGWLIVNADDAHSVDFIDRAGPAYSVIELGLKRGEALVRPHGAGWRLLYHGELFDLPLAGKIAPFQAWNAAAGALLAHAAGVPLNDSVQRLATCPVIPGRMEICSQSPLTYVDYACTPQAIQRCIKNLKYTYPDRKLTVVFGCGGDRDSGKRPLMGLAAAAADRVIITNDNPRTEAPEQIVEHILSGALADHPACQVIYDRGAAIAAAMAGAGESGIVAVLGKGHETIQIMGTEQHPWSDRDFVRSFSGSGGDTKQ